MSPLKNNKRTVQGLIEELTLFASIAEVTLKKIESNLEANRSLFSIFSDRMLAIRGTALQLGLPHVAHYAGLAEEIAVKAVTAENKGKIRRCVGALWDALTTVKFLLENSDQETTEEQKILENRLISTLQTLGGARPLVDEDEIAELLLARDRHN